MKKKVRIALGMSGGVDSSVSVAVLQEAGYEVVGVTCIFVDDERSRKAVEDSVAVCKHFGIEHRVHRGTKCFEREVIDPFIQSYLAGKTPSPCPGCNARCKIPLLLEAAEELLCENVATGHYAGVAYLEENGRYVVRTALDRSKDQSYMLATLTQAQLARLVLPLAHIKKTEVREMAQSLGLHGADKPESQDICFVKGSLTAFLETQGLKRIPGNVVNAEGEVVGKHEGLFAYTLGQRKGLGIAASEPYYVIGKRTDRNELVVGFEKDSFIQELEAETLNWLAFDKLEESLSCEVKLRYRSNPASCTISPQHGSRDTAQEALLDTPPQGGEVLRNEARLAQEKVSIRLNSPQKTTAAGQYAVFYKEDIVLGCGVLC